MEEKIYTRADLERAVKQYQSKTLGFIGDYINRQLDPAKNLATEYVRNESESTKAQAVRLIEKANTLKEMRFDLKHFFRQPFKF